MAPAQMSHSLELSVQKRPQRGQSCTSFCMEPVPLSVHVQLKPESPVCFPDKDKQGKLFLEHQRRTSEDSFLCSYHLLAHFSNSERVSNEFTTSICAGIRSAFECPKESHTLCFGLLVYFFFG